MAKILAHYMPWFKKEDTDPGVSTWSHWYGYGKDGKGTDTPFTCQESRSGPGGIASKLYPEGGPYDSRSDDTVERHVRLMREHRIDGIVIDWNGVGTSEGHVAIDDCDFAGMHSAAKTIAKNIEDANHAFEYALCFDCNCEERLARNNVDPHEYLVRSLDSAVRDFMKDKNHCLKHNGIPVLFVFGDSSAGVLRRVDWTAAIDEAKQEQDFLVVAQLHHHDTEWATGAFCWLPVACADKSTPERTWPAAKENLRNDYELMSNFKAKNGPTVRVGIAFPGVDDIYEEDLNPDRHLQIIQRESGKTLNDSFELAMKEVNKLDFVQIVTFNDWNEGTQIEPSEGDGKADLKIIAKLTRTS